MGTDRDRQGQAGTERERKDLSLRVTEKIRDKTKTKPANTEQGQNRDKKEQLSRKKQGQTEQRLNRDIEE